MQVSVEGYEVLYLLGQGGMASVYLARHVRSGTHHALKVLREYSPTLASRLRVEGRLQCELQHDNVLRVTDVLQTTGGQPALLMEYIDGPTLAGLIDTGLSLDVAEIDALGRGILSGVAAAHGRGWVHRDLKPANVLLSVVADTVVPKVADFGLAKVLDAEGGSTAGTTTKRGIGTRRYMPLEQVSGAAVDKRMDVFALGAVLYEIIEGRPAFPTLADWEHAIRAGTAPAPTRPDIPERFRRAVTAALSRGHERPADAPALLALWQDEAPLRSRFRTETLRAVAIAAAHLLPERLGQSEYSAVEAEHLSVCTRCRDQRVCAPEAAEPDAPSTFLTDDGLVLALSWASSLAEDEPELRALWARATAEHRGRAVVPRDSVDCVRFDDAVDGYRFAVAVHDALREHPGRVGRRVDARMVLDVGEGTALAVELLAIALPGQILATRTALDVLSRSVLAAPGGEVPWVGLGRWRLVSRPEPVELFEVGREGCGPPADVLGAWRVVWRGGAWVPAKAVPHALPAEHDAFVGRDGELRALAERLQRGERLVTLHGAAGVGKTRLALHYGREWLGAWPGGAYFCDLADVHGLDGIVSAVAGALGVPLQAGDRVVQLGHAIAARGRCLLLLDNFEHLVEHAAQTVRPWLSRAEEAAFVVTSRAPLGEEVEVVLPVEPLDIGRGVELFVERATAARRDFDPLAESEAIRSLVSLLDGLPLAIELCAARARTMRPSAMLSRMGERFRLVAGGEGRPGRQTTLRAALDWSWNLLEPAEQRALARLSVFEGGFLLEAAEAVLTEEAADAPWGADLVQTLLDRALLRPLDGERLGMLVSVQQYARDKLSTEEEHEAEQRHGRYFAAFGTDEALDALETHGGVQRLRALAPEQDNLLAAGRRALDRGDEAVAVGAALAAWAVLELRGPFGPGAELLEQVAHRTSERRARTSYAAGTARQLCGNLIEAQAHYETALLLARGLGDRRAEGIARGGLGHVHSRGARSAEAQAHYEAALAIAREVGDRRLEGVALGQLGHLHLNQGRLEEARALYEEALAIARASGNRSLEGRVVGGLGALLSRQSRVDEARAHHEVALAIAREAGNRAAEGMTLDNLGILDFEQDRTSDAQAHYEAALAVHREVGNRRAEGTVLGHLGNLFQRCGRLDEALARYEEALATHRESDGLRTEGALLGNLANLYLSRGRLDEAQAHYEEALAIVRASGNRRAEGIFLGNLGVLHQVRGQEDEARAHYEAALAVHRETKSRELEGAVMGYLGGLDEHQGRPDEARAHYEEVLAIAREVGHSRLEGVALGALGGIHAAQGRFDEARTCFDSGERLLRELPDLLELGKVLAARAIAEHLAGDLDAARAALREADQLAAELGIGPDAALGQTLASARARIGP